MIVLFLFAAFGVGMGSRFVYRTPITAPYPPLFFFQGFLPLPSLERLSLFVATAIATPRPAIVGSEDLFLENSLMNMLTAVDLIFWRSKARSLWLVAEDDRTPSEGPGG